MPADDLVPATAPYEPPAIEDRTDIAKPLIGASGPN
jgi:hypothetical protein